jgi:hypothetical protein
MVSIDRFPTADSLVNYFGTFDQEAASGVTPEGQPKSGRQHRMSKKGNDLVRKYLWNAAKSALSCNPAVKALYRRLRNRGVRGDVALGHGMRKLLHLVFAIWKSGQPFDAKHYDWEHPAHLGRAVPDAAPTAPVSRGEPPRPAENERADAAATTVEGDENAAGHTQGWDPARQVVTAADSTINSAAAAIKEANPRIPPSRVGSLDFRALRDQVTMEQVLAHLNHLSQLTGSGLQRRGPCPVHETEGRPNRSFSVNLEKQVFRCFHPPCAAQGNVLDLWAAVHRLPLRQAAEDLAQVFHLESAPRPATEKRNPSTEPVNGPIPKG